MKKILLLAAIIFILINTGTTYLCAQVNRMINGYVLDENKQPLRGISVINLSTKKATQTDEKGLFSIQAHNGDLLSFSAVNYTNQNVSISGSTTLITIFMVPKSLGLQDVVVVGYGKQKKQTVTGSISTVSTKELVETPVANVSNALVGRVPGLFATQSSGEPGDNASTIRIRGVGTINSTSQEPLIIIDGIQSTLSVMNSLDANEIDNISVLKDASSTAVYGVRGANGVVIITTKRGKTGKPRVNLAYNHGISQLATMLPMLNSYQYALFRNEAINNDGDPSLTTLLFTNDELWKFRNNRDYTPVEVEAMNLTHDQKQTLLNSPALYYTSHNYFKDQFGANAPQSQYNLNITGGTDNVKYFSSVGYFSQDGVFENSSYGNADINSIYRRYNLRSNFDFNFLKNFQLTIDLSGQYIRNGGILGNPADGDITSSYSRHKAMLVSILDNPPFSGPGIVDGKLVTSFVNGQSPLQSKGASGFSALTSLLTRPYLNSYNTNLNANVRLKHTMDYLTKGLSVSGAVSYSDNYMKSVYRLRSIPVYTAGRNTTDPNQLMFFGGVISPDVITDNYSNNKWRRLYMELSTNYDRTFGKHGITGLLLFNGQKTYDPSLLYNVPSGLMGLVGRVTYQYDNRYLAEINLGYNGSENFPPGKRFGFFPAYSLGWIVTNEKFLPKNNILTYLKVRGSYGEVGNDQIGGRRFLYLPNTWGYITSSSDPFYGYWFGNSNGSSTDPFYNSAVETFVGNPNVTWERAKKSNIGLEMNLFQNKLSFTADIFNEKRSNILWSIGTIPAIVGATLPPGNIGRVSNHGYELQLGWSDKIKQWNYAVKFNVSYAKNRIDYIAEPSYPYPWMNTTGYSIGQYKGFLSDGFYNSDQEAAQHIYSTIDGNKVQAGDLRYKDINGDGILDTKDQVPIGYSNLPRYNFSSALNIGYKGFSLSVLFIGTAQGSLPLNDLYIRNPFYLNIGAAMQWQYDGRWTPEKAEKGIKPTFPRASTRTNNTINGVASDFWLMSTDFIKLKNVEISYRFSSSKWLTKSGISSLRIYANGNNLITWSKMKPGFDPEQQDSGGASAGYVYPMMRVFNFGVNIQF